LINHTLEYTRIRRAQELNQRS